MSCCDVLLDELEPVTHVLSRSASCYWWPDPEPSCEARLRADDATLMTTSITPDECPERDSTGMCNCKRITHPTLRDVYAPSYPGEADFAGYPRRTDNAAE